MTTNETPAALQAMEAEAVAWRVLAEPDLPVHFARSKADAEHLVNNLLTYRKGCTSARAEPLFASSPEIISPSECERSTGSAYCDDPDCPYSHQPLTLRQAYDNAVSRMKAAAAASTSPPKQIDEGIVDGLSEWAGWDQSRHPWGETKHKDAVLEALFRGPWSIEDAAALIGFIDRTWKRRASKSGREK